MNILGNEYFDIENEIHFSPGIHTLGEEMARLVFCRNNNYKFIGNSFLITCDELDLKNKDKSSNSKKMSFNSFSKIEENSNKSLKKVNLKVRNIKKSSLIKENLYPIKNGSVAIKSKFANQFINNKINDKKINESNKNLEENIQGNFKEKNEDVKIKKNNFNEKNNKNNYINQKFLKNNNNNDKKNINNKEEKDNKIIILKKLNKLNDEKKKPNNNIIFLISNSKRNSNKSNKNSYNKDKNNSNFYLDDNDIETIKNEFSNQSIETNPDDLKNLINENLLKGQKRTEEIHHVQKNNIKKNNRNNKKSTFIIEKKLNYIPSTTNIKKNNLIKEKKKYIPVYERSKEMDNHLKQILLYEKEKKIEKENEEKKEIEKIKEYKQNKAFISKEWNDFIQKQKQWKEEIIMKKKIAEIIKYEIPERNKNNRYSRSLYHKKVRPKEYSMDGFYNRLYNDLGDKEGRNEILKDKYKYYFRPNKSKLNYKKFLNKKKIPKNNSELLVTNFNKNNYFLDSQITINGGFLYPRRNNNYDSKYRCIYCYYKKGKDINNFKYKATDNSNHFVNSSSTDDTIGYYSKFTTLDPMLTNESCISNYKNENIKNKEIISQKKQIINSNKIIKRNKKYFEEEKKSYHQNRLFEKFYNKKKICNKNGFNNYKNRNNDKKSFNFNKTVNINGNKYKNFFNIDMIHEL